jgi:TATA-binding protein-associated factor
LTGTLIQNRIHELWATFDFLMPGFLGTSKAFISNFANPISKSQLATASASDIGIGVAKLRQLHQQVLPFILRREKNQVLSELPQMSQAVIHVPMSCIQKNIYNDFCTEKTSQELIYEMEKSMYASDPVAGMSKNVLKSLLFLRLLCTHPSLVLTAHQQTECPSKYLTANASGKMLALADLVRTALQCDDDIFGADGDSSLLYEDNSSDDQEGVLGFLDTQDPWLGEMVSFKSNSRRSEASQTSKCLIFAQFTKSLDVVEDVVLKALMPSVKYVRLDGTVSPDRRMNIVNLFQQDPNVKVLLLTTRVGGIGLNLTSANTVIFLEIDFNPYADFQAQDRCMRIGQTKQVNVYRIVTQGSIEEKMLELQSRKVVITDSIVNNDNSTLYSMGTDRLLDVFTMDDNNDDSTSVHRMKLEYDLEGIVEQCSIDYRNLSVDFFARTFGGLQKSEVSYHIDSQN